MANQQLGGLSNTQWIVVLAAVGLGFFLALSEDVSNFWNAVGIIILAAAVVGWAIGFFGRRG